MKKYRAIEAAIMCGGFVADFSADAENVMQAPAGAITWMIAAPDENEMSDDDLVALADELANYCVDRNYPSPETLYRKSCELQGVEPEAEPDLLGYTIFQTVLATLSNAIEEEKAPVKSKAPRRPFEQGFGKTESLDSKIDDDKAKPAKDNGKGGTDRAQPKPETKSKAPEPAKDQAKAADGKADSKAEIKGKDPEPAAT